MQHIHYGSYKLFYCLFYFRRYIYVKTGCKSRGIIPVWLGNSLLIHFRGNDVRYLYIYFRSNETFIDVVMSTCKVDVHSVAASPHYYFNWIFYNIDSSYKSFSISPRRRCWHLSAWLTSFSALQSILIIDSTTIYVYFSVVSEN